MVTLGMGLLKAIGTLLLGPLILSSPGAPISELSAVSVSVRTPMLSDPTGPSLLVLSVHADLPF